MSDQWTVGHGLTNEWAVPDIIQLKLFLQDPRQQRRR